MEGLIRRIISALITFVIGIFIDMIITGDVSIPFGRGSGDREIYFGIIYLASVVAFCLDPLNDILKDYFRK